MGLDVSHDCWHGAYSAFMRWRIELAKVAGYPPLELMEHYWDGGEHEANLTIEGTNIVPSWTERLPISWSIYHDDPLMVLLDHSDCDGFIEIEHLILLANRLDELNPLLPNVDDAGHIGNWHAKTKQFADGLRYAAELNERVEFA